MNGNLPDESFVSKARMLAFVLLLAAPIVYLVIAYIKMPSMDIAPETSSAFQLIYMLIPIALVAPAMAFFIERMHISNYRSAQRSAMLPGALWLNLAIIKMALVESCYIYGLVAFFLSGDMTRMLWFYPIGIAWTFVHWPRREKYLEFLKKLETP
ncbi:MAG: hypothetical protein KKA42_09555 [candidate division Zixibacteria bacterium]|nr:hypothetical protein [candidate division Zixibacteria bacterium]